MEAYNTGQRDFGENKVQELLVKKSLLPSDINWHFIGHLQSNKVKPIAPFVGTIHSLDRFDLLPAIHYAAYKNRRFIDCLLQFHIASEETKFGLDIPEVREMLSSRVFPLLNNVRIIGVMGMASFTEDEAIIRKEFHTLHDYFVTLKQEFFSEDDVFKEISMGMSGDFQIAIEEGSTMVRIGTAIFGERNYP